MRNLKKTAAITTAILAVSTITASASWTFAGYDTRDLNNIGKVYNEVVGGVYTDKTRTDALPQTSIAWQKEGYELLYPHAGYERLYLEGQAQQITRYDSTFAQWETRFVDFFWELSGAHQIYARQQTNVPGHGWLWDFSDNAVIDSRLQIPTNRFADVDVTFERYGVGIWDYDGKYVTAPVMQMYNRFGVANQEIILDPANPKEIQAGTFFSAANLSRLDAAGHYVVTDDVIASRACSILTKVVTGPSLRGDDPRKVVANEYLAHRNDGWAWDADSLIYGGAEISWTGVMYEMAEPYNLYQYLIINGIAFDGHNDLPRIYRYTGGKATPKVEWKYAFSEVAHPHQVVEFKYIDDVLAVDANGYPIYRYPTGEFANTYVKVTPTEYQVWLKDAYDDVMIGSVSRLQDKGPYFGAAPGATLVANF